MRTRSNVPRPEDRERRKGTLVLVMGPDAGCGIDKLTVGGCQQDFEIYEAYQWWSSWWSWWCLGWRWRMGRLGGWLITWLYRRGVDRTRIWLFEAHGHEDKL